MTKNSTQIKILESRRSRVQGNCVKSLSTVT